MRSHDRVEAFQERGWYQAPPLRERCNDHMEVRGPLRFRVRVWHGSGVIGDNVAMISYLVLGWDCCSVSPVVALLRWPWIVGSFRGWGESAPVPKGQVSMYSP